jgi:lysozyme
MQRSRPSSFAVVRAIALASAVGAMIASAAALPALSHASRPAHAHHRHAQKGIDVSHYQGAIDWPAVARDHVAFAYIKATEGIDGRDAQFARNWRGAERAGIRAGAYHYFIFCRSARAQAANFLAAAPRRAGALPPAVDLETPRRCRVTGPEARRALETYLGVVEARERERAVLYVTPQFYRAYRRYLPERPMWRRSIASRPAPGASWALWQYRSRGRVAGIRTFVDLNLSSAGGRASPL